MMSLFAFPLTYLIGRKSYGHREKVFNTQYSYKGSLLTIGEGTQGFIEEGHKSLITKLDLATGRIQQAVVPLKYGHSIAALNDRHLLAVGYKSSSLSLIDRKEFKHIREIKLPEGYLSSGHFCVGEDELYVNLYPDDGTYKKKTGAIGVFNKVNFKLKEVIGTPGYAPHDLRFVRKDLLVSSIASAKSKSGYVYLPNEGYISFLDTKLKKITSSLNIKLNATPTHVGVFDEDHIFVATNQYIPIENRKLLKDYLGTGQIKDKFLALSNFTFRQKKIAMSTPLVLVGSNNKKKMKFLNKAPGLQRRLLSFSIDKKRKEVFVTCGQSNLLLCLDGFTGDLKSQHSGFDLGLSSLQGVCRLPDGNLALSDSERGIILYNPVKREVIRKYDVTLNLSTHLEWVL